jgi:hypothetical protein
VQEDAFNIALIAAAPVLLTDSGPSSQEVSLPTIASLAQQLAAQGDVLLAESSWRLSEAAATWLPAFYALVPVQGAHLLAYRCAPWAGLPHH